MPTRLQPLSQENNSAVLQVDSGHLLSRVKQLMECVAKPGAILQCSLAKQLTLILGTQSNYIGVLHTLTSRSQVNHRHQLHRK